MYINIGDKHIVWKHQTALELEMDDNLQSVIWYVISQ